MISKGQVIEVVDTIWCCFSHSAHWLPSRTTTLPGGQSRSWSTDQGKKGNIKNLAAHPAPPRRAARSKKINRKSRHASTCLGATQVSVRLASAQGFLRLVGWANWYRFARLYASVCDDNFTSISASLFFWRCLAARLSLLSSTRPWTSAHPPRPFQRTPQAITPSLSNLPLCRTPGCRSVRNRFTLSPSHFLRAVNGDGREVYR